MHSDKLSVFICVHLCSHALKIISSREILMRAKLIRSKLRTEIRECLILSVPLASAQVSQAATGFVDTVMMGWLGREVLAAGGLASSTFTALLITVTGVVLAVSPLVAEAYGAGQKHRVEQVTRQSLWLSVILGLPVIILLLNIDGLMRRFGQEAQTVALAKPYLDALLWGYFPALGFAVLKTVVSSLSQPRIVIVVVIFGTLFNAIGNYILGFGKLGLPAMGLAGIGWASTMTQWGMFLVLIIYMLRHPFLKTYQFFQDWYRLEGRVIWELLYIGLPIGVSFAMEVGLFTVTTYLMGILGTDVLAAHQIVFQTIILIFMVPFGMSFATTIRVGQWIGRGDRDNASLAGYVSMGLAAGFMIVMAIVLLVFSQQVIGLYLDIGKPENANVRAIATMMLSIAALSQILDGVQTTAAGALRGLKDTRIPMLLSILAFWCVGLGSGYVLGFRFGLGGIGLWLGLCFGVATSAVVFAWRFQRLVFSQGKSFD